ncbi:MAG: hypothetical protein JO061_00020 [Acidobacteriaceae bacterium]|nr:hypothetical protein [Acidobacteriaceae bacterium]
MINTVHEDDLAAWYRVPDPIGEISIHDFDLDDDDLAVRGLYLPSKDGESLLQVVFGTAA